MARRNSSLPPLFLCVIDGRKQGPFSITQLKQMAANGQLLPSTPVWKEGREERIPAAAVEGLFAGSPAAARSPTMPQSSPGSPGPRSSTSAGPLDIPLIRIRYLPGLVERGLLGLFHGYEVTGYFPDAIVTGRFCKRPQLTEEDCSPSGLSQYLLRSSFRRVIPFSQVVRAQFVGQVQKTFRGQRRPGPVFQLSLDTLKGRRRAYILRQNAPNVMQHIRTALGQRLSPAVRWRWEGLSFMKSLILLNFVVFAGTISLFVLSPQLSIPLFFFTLFAGTGSVVLLDKLLEHDCTEPLPPECLTAAVWPPIVCDAASFRQPYRSPTLGLCIRTLGMLWLFLVIAFLPPAIKGMHMPAAHLDFMRDSLSENYVRLFTLPAVVLLYLGQAFLQSSASRAFGVDNRRPILYLRSFALDGTTTLQPDSLLSILSGVSGTGSLRTFFAEVMRRPNFTFNFRVLQLFHPLRLFRLGLGVVADTAESSMVTYFSELGPVIAIGKPGEKMAELGAHREYVADDVWQNLVQKYLKVCQAVILQPGHSAGMAWELETVFRSVPREKILVLIADAPGQENNYEDVRRLLAPLLPGRPLPKCAPYRGLPALLWFERDGTVRGTEVSYRSPITWLFRGDAVDLEYTLRPFVQGVHGGDRETPRPVRRFGWHHFAAAWLLVLILVFIQSQWVSQGILFVAPGP